jgi:putative ATP-dependent endonuclease of the OLD family
MSSDPKLFDFAFSFSNYRCFGSVPAKLTSIKPINLVIGRNNCGKSTLVRCIRSLLLRETCEQLAIEVDTTFNVKSIQDRLPSRTSVKGYYVDSKGYCERVANEKWSYRLEGSTISSTGESKEFEAPSNIFRDKLASMLKSWKWVDIASERDIRAEEMSHGTTGSHPSFFSNGDGFTAFIEYFLHHREHNIRPIIEGAFIEAINKILRPDNCYKRLLVNRSDNGIVEIFLDEETKGNPIPLSATGSGVKTILQVLGNLILLPAVQPNFPYEKTVFSFEELENNLHPTTIRRLFEFIREYSETHNCTFFITTHSHLVIDQFSSDERAQLIHVSHDGAVAQIQTIDNSTRAKHLIDDLGVRASDLLQTNVVVWVEGPSDAIYFEKWMELHSGGKIRRGIDYQCVVYGGDKIASHMTFDDELVDNLIECSKICRNNIFLIDSNKANVSDELTANTQRLEAEVRKANGISWVTFGREVENYLPTAEISAALDLSLTIADEFVDIFQEIKRMKGIRSEERKVGVAHKVLPLLSRANIYKWDLMARLEECENFIRNCNSK